MFVLFFKASFDAFPKNSSGINGLYQYRVKKKTLIIPPPRTSSPKQILSCPSRCYAWDLGIVSHSMNSGSFCFARSSSVLHIMDRQGRVTATKWI